MKKIKIAAYIVGVLWIAAGVQLLVNKTFVDDRRIIDAFANGKSEIVESRLELALDYGAKFLSEEDKKELIGYMADSIGLNKDYQLIREAGEKTSSLIAEKHGKNADTNIEVVSVREQDGDFVKTRQYVIVRMTIYDKTNSILDYKRMLEKAAEDLKAGDYQTLITFAGQVDGKLSKEETDAEVDKMLGRLQAKVIAENREENLYTVYAYTGLAKDSLRAAGEKININVAVSYDETTDKTNIYLATPVLNEDF